MFFIVVVAEELIAQSHVYPDFYVSPEMQLELAQSLIIKYPGWGFDNSNLPNYTPTSEGLRPNEFWALDIRFAEQGKNPGTLTTLLRLAEAINRKTPIFNYNDIYRFFADIRPLDEVDKEPSITWKILDYTPSQIEDSFCDHINTIVCKYPADRLATSVVLSAMLLMPDWVTSMNGIDVPYVIIPGYKVFTCGFDYPNANWRKGVYVCKRRVFSKLVAQANMVDFGRASTVHQSKSVHNWSCCLVR